MGMNQPGSSQAGLASQPLLQPQSRVNRGSEIGMTQPLSGMSKQLGMRANLGYSLSAEWPTSLVH